MTNPYTLGAEIVARMREIPALVALTEGQSTARIEQYLDTELSLLKKVLSMRTGSILVAWIALESLGLQSGAERYAHRFGVYGRPTGNYGEFLEALLGQNIGATGRKLDEYAWEAPGRSIMLPATAARSQDDSGQEFFEVTLLIPDRTI